MKQFAWAIVLLSVLPCANSSEPASLTQFTKAVSPAIVSVQSLGMDSGSGVLVSPDGLILTSSNLLGQRVTSVSVRTVDGRELLADVVAIDRSVESALVRIKSTGAEFFPFLALSDSMEVKTGSWALTAGNPLDSLSKDHQVAFSVGTITSACDVQSADAASSYRGCALLTDAAINAGSEGGALLDERGRMIGLISLCVDRVRLRGCAIPIHRIKSAFARQIEKISVAGSIDVRQELSSKAMVNSSSRTSTSIVPGMQLQIVSGSGSNSAACVCRCIVSATGRCDGQAIQIDARLNGSDAGAKVLDSHGTQIGTVSQMNLSAQLEAQNSGVSFFTPLAQSSQATERVRDVDPIEELVANCSKAFVFIGDGSGVLISDDGLVLTNEHVAGSQQTWSVRLGDERERRMCDVVCKDVSRDLCLLKIRGIANAPYIKLGKSSALNAGEKVLALGDPFKLGDKNGDPAASLGIISALHRNQGRYKDAIQTDCAINPGNSGGPLINMAGELVGLNGQIISRYAKNNTGVAFAIPIDQIKRLIPEMIIAGSQTSEALVASIHGETRPNRRGSRGRQ